MERRDGEAAAMRGDELHSDAVDGYLRRLGLDRSLAVTGESLRVLHRTHLQRIPFENISIHLREPIVLSPPALVDKIVRRQRGGFCYELNGAFASLLQALGFQVTLLAARVHDGERFGPPFDHLCLRVDLEESWLVDVGFGDSFTRPLRLDVRDDQVDPVGVFRIVEAGSGPLDVLRDGRPQYRFDLTPRHLAEYEPMCRYHQTSPSSHFTQNTVCSRATRDGRITIRGGTLIVTSANGRTEQHLDHDALREAYRRHFGMDVVPAQLTESPVEGRPSSSDLR